MAHPNPIESGLGRSLLLGISKRDERHRASREPTLDTSKVNVRFSFQGPRQAPCGVAAWGGESYSPRSFRQLLFRRREVFLPDPLSGYFLAEGKPLSRRGGRRTLSSEEALLAQEA